MQCLSLAQLGTNIREMGIPSSPYLSASEGGSEENLGQVRKPEWKWAFRVHKGKL